LGQHVVDISVGGLQHPHQTAPFAVELDANQCCHDSDEELSQKEDKWKIRHAHIAQSTAIFANNA
jgi:hypothetical protein